MEKYKKISILTLIVCGIVYCLSNVYTLIAFDEITIVPFIWLIQGAILALVFTNGFLFGNDITNWFIKKFLK